MLSFGLLTFQLLGCSGEAEKDDVRDATVDDGRDTDALADAGDDTGGSQSGLDAGDMGGSDVGGVDAGEPDAEQADMGSEPGDLPFRGAIVLDGMGIREAEVAVPVSESGVLVVELYDATVDIEDVTLRVCTGESSNTCVGTSFRTPPRDYVPHRAVANVEPGDVRIEFSISSFTEPPGPQTVDVSIEFLSFETIDAPPPSHAVARTLVTPGAYRVSVSGGVPAWFEVDLDRPGFLAIQRASSVYLCDMAAWTPNPEGCRTGTRETERDIVVPGQNYLIAESTFDTTREFLVFFDEDPTASVCAAGQHPAGDGTCAPTGTCASGHHDGGWGTCVPDGTCSPNFELRADGRCEGWVAAGTLEVFDAVNDEVLAGPDGTVIVSGGRRDSNGNRVYAPQVWDPATRAWSTASPIGSPVGTRRFCPLSDGRVLTMRYGGFVTTAPANSERIFDPAAGTWSVPATTPDIEWTRPTCLMLDDGQTLFFEAGRALLFDPTTELWVAAGPGPSGHDHVGAQTSTGHVYSAAGDAVPAISRHLWRWDATDDSWTQTPDWTFADELDDDVFVVGVGADPVIMLRDGRLTRFATGTGQWQTLAPIVTGNSTFIWDADVLGNEIFFTHQDAQGNTAGRYDTVAQMWTALPRPTFFGVPVRSQNDYLLIGEHPQRLQVGD